MSDQRQWYSITLLPGDALFRENIERLYELATARQGAGDRVRFVVRVSGAPGIEGIAVKFANDAGVKYLRISTTRNGARRVVLEYVREVVVAIRV